MRLIDADDVVKYCCGYFGHCTQECTKCGFANSVRNIPTAYDVNKVVERLQYSKNPYSDIDLRQYNNALDLAIAIVKRGGN